VIVIAQRPEEMEEAFVEKVTRRRLLLCVVALIIVAVCLAGNAMLSAQTAAVHLNPAVEKLAQGKAIIGTNTTDLSLQNARALARADFDYVYVDMEHSPLNFDGLHTFLVGMIDKAAILRAGNARPRVAALARFPPYGREQAQWYIKQALDTGLMGIIFNGVDTKEQALLDVRNMRYPQKRGAPHPDPAGMRGYAPGYATWVWGISADEYQRHADVWPLEPDGDLLAIPMIETLEGLQNVNEIAAVPGIAAIFVGAGADLSQYLGVPMNSPEVEAARQTILKACQAHNVACGITANGKDDVARRLREGWKMIRTGAGGG
jgi:4-hydroxy-2-oxoheptanedioate aldolase